MQFVSCKDHDILWKAELLEVLDNYECRTRVAAETLREILLEIAHKELVQKPMHVIDCWRELIQLNITLNHDGFVEMYGNLKRLHVAELRFCFPTCQNSQEV